MLLVGIDWGTAQHVVNLMKETGSVVDTFQIKESYDGYIELLDKIRQHAQDEEIVFAVESVNLRIVDFLLSCNLTGYYIEPNALNGYRGRYTSSGVKSDVLDSFILADLLRTERNTLTRISKDSPFMGELKGLLKDRDGFIRSKTKVENRLRICLREYYPEALQFFTDLTGKAALEFFEAFPTIEEAKRLSAEELSDFLSRHKCYNHKTPQRIVEVLSKPAIPVPEVIIKVKSRMLFGLIKELKTLRETIKGYEEEIRRLVESHEETRLYGSLPGAGPIISGGLYTLFGEDRTRYASANEVQAFAGTVPVTFQSGKFIGIHFRYRCNHFYRYLLQQYAFCSLKESQWARDYYKRKRREGKDHSHTLRCLANLWLKVIFAMWKHREYYDEERHLASIARHWLNNRNNEINHRGLT